MTDTSRTNVHEREAIPGPARPMFQVPASLTRPIYGRHRASPAVTAYKEFAGRSHLIATEKGWEEVPGYALDWATVQAEQGRRALQAA